MSEQPLDTSSPTDEPVATTAGVEDHENPWVFMGDEADAPTDPANESINPATPEVIA